MANGAPAQAAGVFHAENPATGEPLPDEYPISTWADCDAALTAAAKAAPLLRAAPPEQIADFLTRFAARIEGQAAALVEMAHLGDRASRNRRAWRRSSCRARPASCARRRPPCSRARGPWPAIDTKINLRSCFEPIGPVVVIGPNNFPFAFNSVAGGDFAAAHRGGKSGDREGAPVASRHDAAARLRGGARR